MLNRKSKESLSGRTVDAELIMQAAEAYRQQPPAQNTGYLDFSYRKTMAMYDDIYSLARSVFQLKSRAEFEGLSREQAGQFDALRRQGWEQEIESARSSERVKQAQREWLQPALAPLTYAYSGGYNRYLTIMYTTAILAGAAITILLSGLFSEEYATGMDSLLLSSRHGKGLLIGAKLFVAFAVSLALILLLEAGSFIEAITLWGSGGAKASLALRTSAFPYPLTIWQAALWYSLCAAGACLLFSAIACLLSAALKSPVNAVILLSILLVVPMFIHLSGKAPYWLHCLLHLLPTSMMDYGTAFCAYPYALGGLILPPYVFMPLFSAAAAAGCTAFACRAFKNHAVG